jgi:hypothetical protein
MNIKEFLAQLAIGLICAYAPSAFPLNTPVFPPAAPAPHAVMVQVFAPEELDLAVRWLSQGETGDRKCADA